MDKAREPLPWGRLNEETLAREYQTFHAQSVRPYQHSFSVCLPSKWYYPGRRDPYNRFYVMVEGEGQLTSSDETIRMKEGRAYFIPRNRVYTMSTEERFEKFWVHFDWEILPGLDGGDLFDRCLDFEWPADSTRRWKSWCHNPSSGSINLFKGALWTLLGTLVNTYEADFHSGLLFWDKYRPLLELFSTAAAGSIGVAGMAEAMGMSQPTLFRHFKGDFSCSPRRWLADQRLNQAEQMLLVRNLSIKETAYRLGWEDPSYFTRFFRKERGMSPAAFRSNHRYVPVQAGETPRWDLHVE